MTNAASNQQLEPCQEEWRPVHHPLLAHRYQVSSQGRVRSLIGCNGPYTTPRLVRIWPDRDGYSRVSLYIARKTYGFTVHSLVLRAFVGEPQEGQEASHADHVRSNNALSNLCWETHLENEQRKTESGNRPIGERNHAARLTAAQVKALRLRWNNGRGVGLTTLSKEVDVCESALYHALKGNTWKRI